MGPSPLDTPWTFWAHSHRRCFHVQRPDAGIQLGERLQHLKGEDLVVLGLPRGGVPVAFQVAKALAAPLDVIVVRKLGVPFQPELAMGAVGEGGVRVLNEDVVSMSTRSRSRPRPWSCE